MEGTDQISPAKTNSPDFRKEQLVAEELDNSSIPTPASFGNLPTELRLQIWELAIPHRRIVRVGFITEGDGHEYARAMGRVTFPMILHICHESREVARKLFRLGFGIENHKEDRDWWCPSTDILYLPAWQPPLNWDFRISFDFQLGYPDPHLDARRDDSGIGLESRHTCLATVQHLALPFNFKVLNGIKFSEGSGSWLPKWLHGFRSLRSVRLLIDHFPQWYRAGAITLYEPTDVPINNPPGATGNLTFNTPSRIEEKISQKLAEFRQESEPDWVPPTVEISVVGHSEMREPSGFYLPIQSRDLVVVI